jgi:hypothetical protein
MLTALSDVGSCTSHAFQSVIKKIEMARGMKGGGRTKEAEVMCCATWLLSEHE